MGILSSISIDVEALVKEGFDDFYIIKSVGEQPNNIQFLINHFRNKHSIDCENTNDYTKTPNKIAS